MSWRTVSAQTIRAILLASATATILGLRAAQVTNADAPRMSCAFLIKQGIAVRTGAHALRKSLFPILDQL